MSKHTTRLKELQQRLDYAERRAVQLAQPDYKSMTDEDLAALVDESATAVIDGKTKLLSECTDAELLRLIARELSITPEQAARLYR